MASHPSNNDEINIEPQSQPHKDETDVEPPSQPRNQVEQPQQTSTHVTQIPGTSDSSHSQSLNQSNRISPAGTTESHVPLVTRPTVSFPNIRDTSAATLGSPERLDLDVLYPAYNQADARVSRPPAMRVPNGEPANSRRSGSDLRRSTLVASEDRYHPVRTRLADTLKLAREERNKSQLTARTARWTMLFVAGAQVLLGAMTTGLSALRLDGTKSASATTALGILSTLSGSYLAHVRATQEPEKSIMRIHKLDAFIRKLDAFIIDNGDDTTKKYNQDIDQFRHDIEVILAADSSLSTSLRPNILPVDDKQKLVSKDASV